jgi:hypothetical protein
MRRDEAPGTRRRLGRCGLVWLAASVVSLATEWVLGEWLAPFAGLALIVAMALLWQRSAREFRRWCVSCSNGPGGARRSAT